MDVKTLVFENEVEYCWGMSLSIPRQCRLLWCAPHLLVGTYIIHRNHYLFWKSYIVPIENTYGDPFGYSPIVFLIGIMNTRRNTDPRLEEEVDNTVAPSMISKFLHLKKMIMWSKPRLIFHLWQRLRWGIFLLKCPNPWLLKHKTRRFKPKLWQRKLIWYCSPSSSTSNYHGFPSKGLLSIEPSYFLWV